MLGPSNGNGGCCSGDGITEHFPLIVGEHFCRTHRTGAMGWSACQAILLPFCFKHWRLPGFVKIGMGGLTRVKLLVRCMVLRKKQQLDCRGQVFCVGTTVLLISFDIFWYISKVDGFARGCYILWPMHLKEAVAVDTLDWKTAKNQWIYSCISDVMSLMSEKIAATAARHLQASMFLWDFMSIIVTTFRTSKHVQDAAVESGDSRCLGFLWSLWIPLVPLDPFGPFGSLWIPLVPLDPFGPFGI